MFQNPYSPYGYPFPQQQNSFQPQMQPPVNGPELITVPTVDQIEKVSLQPGRKYMVMAQNEPVFALRAADNMGLVTTDYYRFEKIEPGEDTAPPVEYVTRKEFDEFVAAFKKKEEKK